MDIDIQTTIGHTRTMNQDYAQAFKNEAGILLAVLCDGMGGHQAGEIASKLAVSHIGEAFEETNMTSSDEISEWLKKIIQSSNQVIYEKSLEEAELKGMGTTVVAAVLLSDKAVIANVGDSRAYIYTFEQLRQISEDHSFVNELFKRGEITREEALNHPQRNLLTQSLGVSDDINVDVFHVMFGEEDVLLLATDGLYEGVPTENMVNILQSNKDVQKIAKKMVEKSLENVGTDNITICVVKNSKGKEAN